MDRWTKTSGYPLVKATYAEGNIHLNQHRFYLNPLAESDDNVWPIPLFSGLNLGKNDPLLHRSINVRLVNQPENLLINEGRRGFYRTIYDDASIKTIVSDDFMNRVSDVDRLGLLADAIESAKAGYLPTSKALELLKSYRDETSVVVWEVIAGALGSIRGVMDDEDLRESIKPYIRSIIQPELSRLGLKAKKTDSHFDKLLRPIILGMAASADEPTVVKEMKDLFKHLQTEQIDPDIRGVVYGTIARNGKQADFDKLVALHNKSTNSEERLKLASAITNFKQPSIYKKAIAMISSSDVRSQDVSYWVAYNFANHYSRDEAWKWLQKNWLWLEQTLGEDLSFYRMPFYVARCYSSLDFLKEFEDFFNSHLSPSFERPLKQSIETIQWQSDWKKRDLASIKNYFKQD
jgi:aminopeptidase N